MDGQQEAEREREWGSIFLNQCGKRERETSQKIYIIFWDKVRRKRRKSHAQPMKKVKALLLSHIESRGKKIFR